MKNRKLKIMIFIVFLVGFNIIFSDVQFFNNSESRFNLNNKEEIRTEDKEMIPVQAKFWTEEDFHLVINDTDPNQNWAEVNDTYNWCNGKGTLEDPYIIENVSINGGASGIGIEILDSNSSYFIVKNTKIYNATIGIKLYNSSLGFFLNNSCFNNSQYGIYLDQSFNNTLSENNVSLNGLDTITEVSGIFLSESNNNTLYNNTVSSNLAQDYCFGIYLKDSNNNNLTKNTANSNKGEICGGIWVKNSNSSWIIGNTASHNSFSGIILGSSENCTFQNNRIIKGGFYFESPPYYQNDLDTSNLVNGKPLYYYINEENLIPNNFSDPGQIFLYNCNYSHIFDINLFNSSTGLWIEKSNNITIDKCNFSDNIYSGVYIRNTFNTSILGSFFKNNSKYGLFYWSGNNYTIDNNTFKQNLNYGIYGYGHNNTIMRNKFNYNFHALSVSGKNYTISSNSAYKNDVSFLFFGDNYTIYNNSVSESSSYAFKFYGDYSLLNNNTAKYCGGDGFYLRYSNNELLDNQILNNKNGIYIHGSSNLIFENKVKSNSNFGLITDSSSSNNTIYNNIFNENNINAWDNGTDNNWDNGLIGNFWDDYGGIDYNDDGIGDNPYSIGGIADAKDFFPIFTDGSNPPYLEVINPINGTLFGETPPEFVIRIQDASLSKSWYNISDGDYVSPNIFIDTNGSVNEDEWNRIQDGSIILNFYANDTVGNENWVSIEIFKDTTAPNIIVNKPLTNKTYGREAPQFNIEIHDLNFNSCWYKIEGWPNNFTLKSNGTINQIAWQSVWDSIKSGDVITITFYANDTLNHLSSVSIGLEKYESLIKGEFVIYSAILSIFMISSVISLFWSFNIIFKKSSFKGIMRNASLRQLITKFKFRDSILVLEKLRKNFLRRSSDRDKILKKNVKKRK